MVIAFAVALPLGQIPPPLQWRPASMGAWGVGPLDNDTAGDLALFWDRYITRGRKQDPRFWTPGAITELFRFSYFRGGGRSGVQLEDSPAHRRVSAQARGGAGNPEIGVRT